MTTMQKECEQYIKNNPETAPVNSLPRGAKWDIVENTIVESKQKNDGLDS